MIRQSRKSGVWWISFFVLTPFCIFAVLPVWVLIISSFASSNSLALNGFQLVPSEFSLGAYQKIFAQPEFIIRAYGISLYVTVVGTVLGVFTSAMFAYALARPGYRFANGLAFFIFFTLLFSGGTLSNYLLISRYLGLKNNLWSLILPILIAPFNILLLRSYFKSIPTSLLESAFLDGAGEFKTFMKIVFPLSLPAITTVGLFVMLAYWNDMNQALLYIDKQALYPLQYLLYKLTFNMNIIPQSGEKYSGVVESPLALRMALATMALIPILLSFASVQKYFVRGVMVGSLKGD